MMTPQEVANCTFTKAVMGGYHMAAVDDFLDKVTEDYTALFKENATLKAKMKVLVEKMEEYREVEDAMRSTLLTAQKMANSMVAEAEEKRDALIADAAGAAKARMAELQQQIDQQEQRLAQVRRDVDGQIQAEQQRLALAQAELRDFIRTVENVCTGQLALLERLPQLPVVQEAPPEEDVQPAPAEEDAPAPETDTALEQGIQDALAAFAQEKGAPAQGQPPEQEDPFDQPAPAAEEDLGATRVLNLDELQFGRNYKP